MLVSHFMITYLSPFGKLKGSSYIIVRTREGGASEQQNRL